MLSEKIILLSQEQEGDYLFYGNEVETVCTKGFKETFGDETDEIVHVSRYLISSTYENPDYLQKFTYKGITYWCIGEFHKEDKLEDYIEVSNFYITFLLPSEY
jgi:hypothetical protein